MKKHLPVFLRVFLILLSLASVAKAGSIQDQVERVDAEKAKDYKAESKKAAPLDELSAYIDRVFMRVREKLKSKVQHTDKSAAELKKSIGHLQKDIEKELSRQKKGRGPQTEREIAERRAALDKLRAHLEALGEDVSTEVQKAIQKLDQLMEQEKSQTKTTSESASTTRK